MTLEELSDLYFITSCAFDNAKERGIPLSDAIDLQITFENSLSEFKSANPDIDIFIDCINKNISVKEKIIMDEDI